MEKGSRHITARDLQALRFLAVAGGLSVKQLWRLLGSRDPENGVANLRKRFLKLAKAEARCPAYVVCHTPPAPLEGEMVVTLTAAASDELGLKVPLGLLGEMDWQQIRHILLAGEVFVGLMERYAGVSPLPFRWFGDRGTTWKFDGTTPGSSHLERMAIRPDAIVEAASRNVRAFVEFETGTNSIRTERLESRSAIIRKAARYAAFFAGRTGTTLPGAGRVTHYSQAFTDGRVPILLFVVDGFARRKVVTDALLELVPGFKQTGSATWEWHVVATAEAGVQLESLLAGGSLKGDEEVAQLLPAVPHLDVAMAAPGDLTWVRMPRTAASAVYRDLAGIVRVMNAYRDVLGKVARQDGTPEKLREEIKKTLSGVPTNPVVVLPRIRDALRELLGASCLPPATTPAARTAAPSTPAAARPPSKAASGS